LDDRKEPTFGPSGSSNATSTAAPSPTGMGKLALEAGDIVGRFMHSDYQDERGVHVESILSATAALAGFSAQQAALTMIKEGRPEAKQFPQMQYVTSKSGRVFLFSELTNQFVASAGGPERLTVLTLIANGGLRAGGKQVPNMLEIVKRNAQFMGSDNYPSLSVPPQHFPRENALVALQRWWPLVVKIFSVNELRDLHPLYWMLALSHLAGQLIEDGKDILNPEVAMVLAMETAVAMSKVTGIETDQSR
jgi:hypothetical protein